MKMNQYFRYVLLVPLLFLFFFTSCQEQRTSSAKIQNSPKQYGELQLDYPDGIIGIVDGNIIMNQFDNADLKFYSYSSRSNEMSYLGIINNFFVRDSSVSILDNSMYFYAGTGGLENTSNSLYKIDVTQNKITTVGNPEALDQALVPTQVIGNKLVSLKGMLKEKNVGKLYVDLYDPQNHRQQTIIEKYIDPESGYGEAIEGLSTCNGEINLLTIQYTENAREYSISTYREDGSETGKYPCNFISQYLHDQYITSMLAYKDYIYIQNASDDCLLMLKTDSEMELLAYGSYESGIKSANRCKESDNLLLFMNQPETILFIDFATNNVLSLDVSKKGYNYLESVISDGEDIIYVLNNSEMRKRCVTYMDSKYLYEKSSKIASISNKTTLNLDNVILPNP